MAPILASLEGQYARQQAHYTQAFETLALGRSPQERSNLTRKISQGKRLPAEEQRLNELTVRLGFLRREIRFIRELVDDVDYCLE